MIGGGAIASVAVLFIAANLDLHGPDAARPPSRIDNYKQILAPEEMSQDEATGPRPSLDSATNLAMQEGAWIQVADDKGQLAQEYQARRLDPQPDQWLHMEKPVARFYLSGNRLLVMSADQARARTAKRGPTGNATLETGRMTGNVVIHLYRHRHDAALNGGAGSPAVIVTADEADFDNGIVRCQKAVNVTSTEHPDAAYAVKFSGEGLTILMNRRDAGVESLVVDRPTSPVEITPNPSYKGRKKREPAVAIAAAPEPAPANAPAPAPSQPVIESNAAAPAVASASSAAPAAVPIAPPGASAPLAPVEAPAWYLLTLEREVRVERHLDGALSTIEGDTLDVLFSMKGEGLRKGLSHRSAPTPADWIVTGHPSTALVMAAIGADQAAAPEKIIITYQGRLTMTPLRDPKAMPDSADEIVLTVAGSPATIHDAKTQAEIFCDHLIYRSLSETAELTGSADHPLRLRHPRLHADGDRLRFDMQRGQAAFVGPGVMRFLKQLPPGLALANFALVSADPYLATALIAADPAQTAQPPTDLQITWTKGVDFEFVPSGTEAPSDESQRLKNAKFNGNVKVVATDFTLDSQELTVGFDPTAKEDDAINLIEAVRDVRVSGGKRGERMSSQHLRVDLKQGAQGSMPTKMVASGAVEAVNVDYTLWTESLEAHFVEIDPNKKKEPKELEGQDDPRLGNVDLSTVRAENGVQVRLAEGARVFADVMHGDQTQHRITFESSTANLMLVHEKFVLDQARSLTFVDNPTMPKSTASIAGPGRFQQFRDVILKPSPDRVQPPSLPAEPLVHATWTDSMEYDHTFNAGAGAIDLRGHAFAVNKPDKLRENTVAAEWLTMQFRFLPKPADAEPEAPKPDAPDGPGILAAGDRELSLFIARQNASVENKVWISENRAEMPERLFRIDGDSIWFNNETRYTHVAGAGKLLVHDTTPASEEDQGAFGAKGTTRFEWLTSMRCTPQSAGGFNIEIEDGVKVEHSGLVDADRLTFTGDRLVADLMPRESSAESGPAPKPALPVTPPQPDGGAEAAPDPLNIGGDLDLVHLRGTGRVWISTPEQEIECHEFDYDRRSNMGVLEAAPGRLVQVKKTGAASPFFAQKAVWDFTTGRIQISHPSANIAR
jgi:hypothetical protein